MGSHRSTNKKLEEAGRFIAGAAANKELLESLDKEVEEAAIFGVDKEEFKAQQFERETLMDLNLFEENIDVFSLFKDLQTQWRYLSGVTKVIPTGLDYASVLAYLDRFYKKDEADLIFRDITIMEAAYLGAKNDSQN